MRGMNFTAFLGGMLIGGVIALLYAPEKGEQTRKQLKDYMDKRMDGIKESYSELSEKIKNTYDRSKTELREKMHEMAENA